MIIYAIHHLSIWNIHEYPAYPKMNVLSIYISFLGHPGIGCPISGAVRWRHSPYQSLGSFEVARSENPPELEVFVGKSTVNHGKSARWENRKAWGPWFLEKSIMAYRWLSPTLKGTPEPDDSPRMWTSCFKSEELGHPAVGASRSPIVFPETSTEFGDFPGL